MSRLLGALCTLPLALISISAHAAALHYDDTNNPSYPTSVTGIDLTIYGFGQYDIFFVSNREDNTQGGIAPDGWETVEAVYGSDFATDIFPSVTNSELLSHHIKRELVRIFNENSIDLISGIADPGGSSYEFHSASGVQDILIPYRIGAPGTTKEGEVQGTFLTNGLSGDWGPDDMTTNTFSKGLNSGIESGRTYWTIVTNTTVVPIPPALWLFGSGLLGLIGVARKKGNSYITPTL